MAVLMAMVALTPEKMGMHTLEMLLRAQFPTVILLAAFLLLSTHPSQPVPLTNFMKIMISFSKKLSWLNKYYKKKAFKQDHCRENLPSTLSRLSLFGQIGSWTKASLPNTFNQRSPNTHTFTERQCEFGHRTGSKSLTPVIVPMYLDVIQ